MLWPILGMSGGGFWGVDADTSDAEPRDMSVATNAVWISKPAAKDFPQQRVSGGGKFLDHPECEVVPNLAIAGP